MKRPDEIKKGLECCADGNIVCAGNCVFDDDVKLGYPGCVKLLMSNALAYIQRLEAQNAEQAEIIRELNAQIGEANKNLDYWQAKIGKKLDSVEVGVVQLYQYCKELQAERDALISDFEEYDELPCALCEHYSKEASEIPCKFCKNLATPTDEDKVSQWEWRGVQKEE